MKKQPILLTLLLVIIFLTHETAISLAYTTLDTPATVTGRGTVPLTQGAVLDDFATGSSLNKWNGTTGTYASTNAQGNPTATCTATWNSAGQMIQVDYNVNQSGSYCGYYSQMGGGNLTTPTTYSAISFYVKGKAGGEFFKVELKNAGTTKYWDATESTDYYRNTASVYISDFLPGGVTTTWQKVTIPFHNFLNLDGFTSMKELVFTFEYSQSAANGSSTQGTIYIDTIQFETIAMTAVKVDPFGDKLTIDSFAGNQAVTGGDSGGTGILSFEALSDAGHSAANALKFNYNVSANGGSYAAASFVFGGGYTPSGVVGINPEKGGWIKVVHNFNDFSKVTFWARAKDTATNPVGFKVELHDFSGVGTGEPFYKITTTAGNKLTTTWQKYSIPFSSFEDWSHIALDKTRIGELVFTIENGNVLSGHSIGAMYIDDVRFEQ